MFKKRDNFITKATEWPFKKFNLTVIIAIVIILFFGNLFIAPINSYVVNPFLSKIESGTVSNWVTVVFITLVLLYFYGKFKRNYFYTGKRITIYAVIILGYSLARFATDEWIFAQFSNPNTWNNIAYLDMLYVLAIPILLHMCDKTKRLILHLKKDKEKLLILDDPIKVTDNDCLYRDKIAKDISDILISIESETSFAVGITSKWGDGKTSFLKMLTSELKKKDKKAIHIEFSPWYCKTEKDIIALFFDTVSTSLKHYHSSLNNQLKKYSKLLLSIEESSISKTIDKGLSIFNEHNDIRSIYDNINESIQNLNRTIYITIDDVDRLLAKEIIECFKIIRNTANFGNVIYIVAYDADYVDKALESGLNNTYKGYIDKIIQLPFQLPVIEESSIQEYLEDRLKEKEIADDIITEILYPKYFPFNTTSISSTLSVFNIYQYLNNIRDCNKLLNIFFTYKAILKDEVELPDLFLVCILKTFYAEEARKIYYNLDEYFNFGDKNTLKDQKSILNATKKKDNKSDNEKNYLLYELNNDIKFKVLVNAIFSKPQTKNPLKDVSRNHNYTTYYNGVVSERMMKYSEFTIYYESLEDLIKTINNFKESKNINHKNKLNDLANKLSLLTPTDKSSATKIIGGLIHILNLCDISMLKYKIISLLNNYKNDHIEILNELIKSNTNINLYNIHMILHFINMYFTNSESNKDFYFIKENISALSIEVLKKKILLQEMDSNVLDIYWNCSTGKWENGIIKIDKKANQLMKDFALAKPIEYLKLLSIESPYDRSKNIRQFHYSIAQTFSDETNKYKEFEEFLSKTVKLFPEDQELKSIEKNWYQYKDKNYEYYNIENLQPVSK